MRTAVHNAEPQMTETPQLRAELFRQINPMLDSDVMLRKMIAYVKSLLAAQQAEQETAQEKDYDEEKLKPYTMEELHARIDKAEREIAAGLGTPHEEVMRRSREKLARKKQELEMPEAI